MSSNKPGYTTTLPVTDAAEVNITVRTYCQKVIAWEQNTQAGWPRNYYFRGPVPGSLQNPQGIGSIMTIPGPFMPGDVIGQLELVSAGGDSTVFNLSEQP